MTLPFVAGQSYLEQLTQEDFRKPHFLLRENNLPYVANGYAGVGGRLLPGRQKPAVNSFQNTDRMAAPSQWPHIPHATLQFGSYVYEDFVIGRTDEKVPVRIYQIFFYLEDNTVEITESQAGNTEFVPPKHLSRQRIPRPNDPNTFLTVYDFTVGKPVIIYGRQHMIYSCDLYTRNTLTVMGFVVPADQEPPYSQIMAASKLSKMDEKLKRHFNTDGHFARFLQYDGQVLRFNALWNDKKSMFGDEHKLLVHFYLSDGTLEILRKTPQSTGRDMWKPFVKRAKIPKKVADLSKVNQGAPWPVLKTMPNGRHPIKNYQLFDQAQFPENVEIFTDADLQCGKEICIFGRAILLADCDDFTKWYYRHRYQKEQQAVHLPDETDNKNHGKVCPYNNHGSEEDSILNCQTLRPTQPLTDLRKYLLVDQDAEDTKSLVFSVKMLTDNAIDGDRNFVMTFSLNDDSICLKERVGNGNTVVAFVEKTPVKKAHDRQTTLPQYLQPEDLYVGAAVQLRGGCFLITEADEATLTYMEKYSQRFPYSDIQKVVPKFFKALPVDRNAVAILKSNLEDQDSSTHGFLDWDQFVKCLTKTAKSALTPHEYNTLARIYSSYPHVSKEKRRELLRSFIQQRLRQAFWDPQHKLLTALTRIDIENRKFVMREEMDKALKATRVPVKFDLVSMYLDLVEAENVIYYEEVVRDLDWVRNPGRHLAKLPEKMDKDFDFNKFFGEDKRKVRYPSFIQDIETFGCR